MQNKKAWYKRWWAITLYVIIVLYIIGQAGGSDKSSTPKSEQAAVQSAPVTQKASEAVKSEVAQEEPKPKMYSLNQPVPVDYLTYTVTNPERFTKMGNQFMSKESEGTFIKVYARIKNNAKETKDLFSARFTLIDDQGRKFERLNDDAFYIADALEFGKQLQPGLSASGALVFELLTDFKGLALIVSGDWLSATEKAIQIDKLTDIGVDKTLENKINQQMEEAMSQCNAPFKCTSSCQQYMDVGQKDCSRGQVCCMQS